MLTRVCLKKLRLFYKQLEALIRNTGRVQFYQKINNISKKIKTYLPLAAALKIWTDMPVPHVLCCLLLHN